MNKYFNIILISIILIAVFLAQQPFCQNVWPIAYEKVVKTSYEAVSKKVINFWQTYEPKGRDFIQKYVLSKITKEVEKRKEIVKEELKKETEKATESIWQNIKTYLLAQFKKLSP